MKAICKTMTAITMMAVLAFGLTTCHKETLAPPTVKLFGDGQPSSVTTTSAGVAAEVTDQGGAEVKSRGFAYGLSGGSLDTIFCGSGMGAFSAELPNLQPNTPYVYEAFAKNAGGYGTSGKVTFITKPLPFYTIDVSVEPHDGGNATGNGTYQEGDTCTVKATPSTGFKFVKWTENNDIQVSTDSVYTFEVTSSRNLVAHFTAKAYTITATVDPNGSGTVMGTGGYNYGDPCTVIATANPGYKFEYWKEGNNQVCSNASYLFTVEGNRDLIAHFTIETYTITATAEPAEFGTATVSGNGRFHYGDQCTLTATPKPGSGYGFVNWTKNGTSVSSDATCSFEVTESAEYKAHFQIVPLSLAVSANPEVIAKGSSSQLKATASGGNGSFTYSWTPSTGLSSTTSQNLTATPNATTTYTCTVTSGSQTINKSCTVKVVCPPTNLAYTVNANNVELTWTAPVPATTYNVYKGNTLIQSVNTTRCIDPNLSSGTYTYRVSTVYSGVESPKSDPISATVTLQVPQGAITGLFSISATQKVWFSKGNLQYKASLRTWQFAANQYDYVGNAAGNTAPSSSQSGWIDLFGWGTSGWNSGANCYQPWSTSNLYSDYYPGGSYMNNLTGSYANADWGVYNPISNGGNQAGRWRVLTSDEWNYVFNERNASMVNGVVKARYARAKVAGVRGVILFPDSYMHPYGIAQPVAINETNNTGWDSNNYSASAFSLMQTAGAVFLPAAGFRSGIHVYNADFCGYYWSSSHFNGDVYDACFMKFFDNELNACSHMQRDYGLSVRLVCPFQ